MSNHRESPGFSRGEEVNCTTLREVAAEVGFCSASHFSRSFAAAAGRAPLAYRRAAGAWAPSGPGIDVPAATDPRD